MENGEGREEDLYVQVTMEKAVRSMAGFVPYGRIGTSLQFLREGCGDMGSDYKSTRERYFPVASPSPMLDTSVNADGAGPFRWMGKVEAHPRPR